MYFFHPEDMVLTAFVFFTVNTLDGEELVLAKLLKLNVVVLSLLPNILPLLVPAKKRPWSVRRHVYF